MKKCNLTMPEQLERFGMPYAQACAIRDRVDAELSDADKAAGRAAWQALSHELFGYMQRNAPNVPRHPEAVRVKLLAELADGATVADAISAARAFAFTESDQ